MQILNETKERMRRAGVQNPDKDIDALTYFVTGGAPVDADNIGTILSLAERRVRREPIERIIREAEFFNFQFGLIDGVFKPGFETETTVEYGLILAEEFRRPIRILDLGTGTGCILLSLLKMLPHSTGVGVDINSKCLNLAKQNALKFGLQDRADFKYSDWMTNIQDKFDVVISNPPRIPKRLISRLVREVAEYDPADALDGGDDGLEFYHRTALDFRKIATADAVCILQVGELLAEQAMNIFKKHQYADVTLRRDYKLSLNSITFRNCEVPPSVFSAINNKLLKLFGKYDLPPKFNPEVIRVFR